MTRVLPQPIRKLLHDVVGYGLVSAVALATDMGLLRALVERGGMNYQPAAALAFTAGAVVAYVLSVRFVFRFHRLRHRGWEFASFVALGLLGLAVNSAALFVAISMAGLGLITAKLLAAVCTFATNFTLRRQLLFASPRP
jgi:putative flippase GtrA